MSNWLSLPVLALAALLQATFVPQIRIFGGGPDLVFLFVLAWSIHTPLETGVIWAFVGGILLDLLSAAPTGASVVGLLMLVFTVHGIHRQVYGISLVVLAGLVLVGTLAQQMVVLVILGLSGFTVNVLDGFTYIIAPTMVYNVVLIWPTYWLARRLQKRATRESRVLAG